MWDSWLLIRSCNLRKFSGKITGFLWGGGHSDSVTLKVAVVSL